MKEILETESANGGYIYMYREGSFWKAYQRSAYMFVMHSPADYMMEYRYVRCVARNVLSIGIPQAAMPACVNDLEPIFLDDTRVRARVTDFCIDDYLEWDMAVKRENVLVKELRIRESDLSDVAGKIRACDVSAIPPSVGMELIRELKKSLGGL